MCSLRGEGLARTGQSPGVSPGSPRLVHLAALAWWGGAQGWGPLVVAAGWPPAGDLPLTLRHALQHAHHVYHSDQLRVHGPARPSALDQICRVSIPRASPAGPAPSAFPFRDSWPQGHMSRDPQLTHLGRPWPSPSLSCCFQSCQICALICVIRRGSSLGWQKEGFLPDPPDGFGECTEAILTNN